ncbi:QueT transporter family protein [Facklamia languida]
MKQKITTYDLTMVGLVAAAYIVLTMILAPLSFGIGLRISEGLNFLALYNKRHIYGITLGVFVVNYFAYGVSDMIVGSLSSLVFLFLGKLLAEWLIDEKHLFSHLKLDPMILKYLIIGTLFSISMFTIAILVVVLGAGWGAFWVIYLQMVVIEAISLALGGVILYLVSQRVDLTK